MPSVPDLAEFELRAMLAIDQTLGDYSKIAGEMQRGGQPHDRLTELKIKLDHLETRDLIERDGRTYRLSATVRLAARQAVRRLRDLVAYADKTLR